MSKNKPLRTVLTRKVSEKRHGPSNLASSQETLDRVTLLAKRLKAFIDALHGRSLRDEEFGTIIGRSRTTINNWLNAKASPDPEALLRMFELLPESEREKLLHEQCRTHPSLDHPRLSHDPLAVSKLRTLLLYPNNVTLIGGPAEHIVTFVATAVGHSFLRSTANGRMVKGLDAHNPDWFVPVPGVHYLGNLFRVEDIRTKARELWPSVLGGGAEAVLLNSVCRNLPDIHHQVINLAKTSHVIIGETVQTAESTTRLLPSAGHVVTVHEDSRQRIHIQIRAA